VPEQEEILMPPMLLQPFAENAIMHGFAGQQEKGQINIRIQKDVKALHCVIEDNGRGFQDTETNLYRNRPPLSTLITQERLALLSRQTKTEARLRVVDKKAEGGKRGVRVELILPYQMED
jgi:sensor histidine kinase YesM